MLNEQLKELIKREADALYDHLNEKAQEVDSYDFGLPMANRQTRPIVECLSQYAAKLQEAEAKAERYEKALNAILNTNHDNYEKVIRKVKTLATDALTPKTGSDDR